jgi:hypothetical protein
VVDPKLEAWMVEAVSAVYASVLKLSTVVSDDT